MRISTPLMPHRKIRWRPHIITTQEKRIISKIRNYPSALAAELDGDNIPEAVYRNLVKSVNENLDVLHRYVGLRKKFLGVDEIRMYDMYAPLMDMPKRDVPYEEARKSSEKVCVRWGKII